MSVSLNVQFRIGTLLKAEKKNVHAHKTRSFQRVPPPFLSGSPPLLGVFVHEWESAKRNLNLNLLTVWFEVIFLSIKSLSGQVVHRAGVYSGFLCFKRPGVFVLPEWNAYRKREGDLKYVTDLIVAFNLLGKRKQLSESYILQNATIICFGCHCSAFNFWYNWNKISCILLKDLLSSIRAITEFVNIPLSEEVIQRIAHQCSFEGMAKNPASFQVFPNVDAISFLRKGDIGDWKNHFTAELNEQFETEFVVKAREHGLEFE